MICNFWEILWLPGRPPSPSNRNPGGAASFVHIKRVLALVQAQNPQLANHLLNLMAIWLEPTFRYIDGEARSQEVEG